MFKLGKSVFSMYQYIFPISSWTSSSRPGDKALLIVGGRGGRGNHSFKTSRNTAPTLAEKGEEGVEVWVDLELKVVADVGIIGVPNAGKSTLLSVITAGVYRRCSFHILM